MEKIEIRGDIMPKISVVVPVYGVENYIKTCIDSLVNQTFEDFEILVINDSTKDRSIEIIKESFNDPRIKIFNKPNGGLADARNFAFKHIKGEYVLYVDSDDYVATDYLEEMYKKALEKDSDIVVCLSNKVENNIVSPLEVPLYPTLDNKRRYILNRPSATCKLIRKSLLEKCGFSFPKGYIYEDIAVIPSLALYTDKIDFLDEYFYYYLIREGSIMNHKQYRKNMEDIFYSINNLYSIFEKENKIDEFKDEIEYIYINHLLHTACLFFLPYKEGEENIRKISRIIKEKFPKWQKNKYYKKRNIKYKIVCILFYHGNIKLAKIVLKKYLKKCEG